MRFILIQFIHSPDQPQTQHSYEAAFFFPHQQQLHNFLPFSREGWNVVELFIIGLGYYLLCLCKQLQFHSVSTFIAYFQSNTTIKDFLGINKVETGKQLCAKHGMRLKIKRDENLMPRWREGTERVQEWRPWNYLASEGHRGRYTGQKGKESEVCQWQYSDGLKINKHKKETLLVFSSALAISYNWQNKRQERGCRDESPFTHKQFTLRARMGTDQACCSVSGYSFAASCKNDQGTCQNRNAVSHHFIASGPEPQRQNKGMDLVRWNSRKEMIPF